MTTPHAATLPREVLSDAEILWDYHQLHHALQPTDVGVGLGSHDIGVAIHAAGLYHQSMFPRIVFTGRNAPTTVDLFPDGEAVHFARKAIDLGVPAADVLVEPDATNTAENITHTRALLHALNIQPNSVTLITRPYQQRRAYATCKKIWPEIDVICTSRRQALTEYLDAIADDVRVVNMLVGDTQRIEAYAERGYAIPQPIPDDVRDAFDRLTRRGFTSRLV